MKMMERDIEILRFINDFGFCEMPQIEKRFGLKKPRSYQVINRLVKKEFLIHRRVFKDRHGIFYLSKKGAPYTELAPIKNIPLGNYYHQIVTIDIYLKLKEQYPDANWISQRHLLRQKLKNGVGAYGHVADGMFLFPDSKQVAIEVELACKNEKALKAILAKYKTDFSIKEVWYFCVTDVAGYIKRSIEKLNFIKIFEIENFWLNPKNQLKFEL